MPLGDLMFTKKVHVDILHKSSYQKRFIKLKHWVLSNQDDVLRVPPVHRVCPSLFYKKWRLQRRHFLFVNKFKDASCEGWIYMKRYIDSYLIESIFTPLFKKILSELPFLLGRRVPVCSLI